MDLTKPELRVIAAVAALPLQSWRTLEPTCSTSPKRARAIRDRLINLHVLTCTSMPVEDAKGRVYTRRLYDVNPALPQLRDIHAWLDAGRSYVLPMLAPDHIVRGPVQRPPGVTHDPRERLLETVLRNVGASWRTLRPTSGLRSPHAEQVREELIDSGDLLPDVVVDRRVTGTEYLRRVLTPNEKSPLVRELRAKYGLGVPAPIPEWLADVRRTIGK